MKEIFVETRNIKKFKSAMQRVKHKLHGVERIALITGEVGLGKTVAGQYFGANNGASMVTIWPKMSQHWLLREVVRELGQEPKWRAEDLIRQIRDAQAKRPRILIFDEMDHFFRDSDPKRIDALETIRKIHDVCLCPVILIGEEHITKKIERIPRLQDRIVETVHFEKLEEPDVKDVIEQVADCRFADDAIKKISELSTGRIRPVMSLIHAGEKEAKINSLKVVTAKDLR